MKLTDIRENVIRLPLSTLDHLFRCFTGHDENGYRTCILRNSDVCIQPVTYSTDLLVRNAHHGRNDINHIPVGFADIRRLYTGGSCQQRTDAAAIRQHFIVRHGTNPVRVCGDEKGTSAQEVAGFVEFFVYKFRIKTDNNYICVFFRERNPVA